MFDKHHHYLAHGPSHVTVTEKRAPTDDSARLLSELEKAARDKITASVRLENTLIDGVIHQMRDHIHAQTDYRIQVKINGKQSEIRRTITGEKTQDQTAEILHRAVADHIASLLLIDAFKSARW